MRRAFTLLLLLLAAPLGAQTAADYPSRASRFARR